MKFTILLLLIFLAFSVNAEEIKWDGKSTVKADINCDGKLDISRIGYLNKDVVVEVKLSGLDEKRTISFGLDSSIHQSSLCGKVAYLAKEVPDNEVFEYGLGKVPEGHNSANGCYDLKLSGGECDSIHVYWNHMKNKLDWWRL